MLRIPVYKLKDKKVVVKDKNFLNAKESDFEEENYFLCLTVEQIKKWSEAINIEEKYGRIKTKISPS